MSLDDLIYYFNTVEDIRIGIPGSYRTPNIKEFIPGFKYEFFEPARTVKVEEGKEVKFEEGWVEKVVPKFQLINEEALNQLLQEKKIRVKIDD